MLRYHTATSATGVKNYFGSADYYSQGSETVGLWGGKLAPELGLEGPVTPDAFGQLCDNINPATGKRLTARTNEFRRVGEDMIFSLPKDVGAAIMLAPPELRDRLLAMAGERAGQVMGVIEADVETRVRRDGAFKNRAGGGLVWAGFLHTTARPVSGAGGRSPSALAPVRLQRHAGWGRGGTLQSGRLRQRLPRPALL